MPLSFIKIVCEMLGLCLQFDCGRTCTFGLFGYENMKKEDSEVIIRLLLYEKLPMVYCNS